MTHVVVTAITNRWTTRSADPTDSWDTGDTAGEVTNVVAYLVEIPEGYYGDSHEKDLPDVKVGDTVYAVVADYSSGSTFGRSGGYATVLDFFTDPDEARLLSEAALKPDGEKTTSWGDKQATFDYSFTHNGSDYSRSWVGYFESLNTLDVWQCRIKSHAQDPWSEDPKPGFRTGW